MVRQGPIPAFVHGLFEYLAGLALIALPLVIGYEHGSATAVSIVLGVLVIFLTAATSWSTSLINQIPLAAHIILDYVLAAILIASPFLFAFSDETEPTVVFIAGGVLHLLVSIGTRYRKDEKPARRGRGGRASASELPRERARPSGGAREGARDDEIPEYEPRRR